MTQPTATPVVPSSPTPTPHLPHPEPPVVSNEVRQFAEENGVAKYLSALLELMARVLPGRQITVRLDWDPSIPDDEYITFWADTEDLSGEEWLAAYRAWQDGVVGICGHGDTHFFYFGA